MGTKNTINDDKLRENIAKAVKAAEAFTEVKHQIGAISSISKWDQNVSMPDASGASYSGHLVATDSTSIPSGVWHSPMVSPTYGDPYNTPAIDPMVGTDINMKKYFGCQTHHTLGADLMEIKDDHVVGTCETCGIRVFIPRVPGAFSFERAGILMGRAMGIMEDEEEDAADLLTEIQAAQERIDKDIRRHKLAMEMLQMAKGMAKKAALKIAEPIE